MEIVGLIKGIFGVENVGIRDRNESVGLGGFGREKSVKGNDKDRKLDY